jgi:hypothetical protein
MRWCNLLSAAVLAMAGTCGVGSAQVIGQGIAPGTVYTFHSSAKGGCPALDWHLVAGPNNTLSGIIAWNDMSTIARASGKFDMPARTFSLVAHEVGGQGRSATVNGTVRQDGWLIANIKAPNVACQEIKVPLNTSFQPGSS